MNITSFLTNPTLNNILDFCMNNLLIFTAGVGIAFMLIAFIIMNTIRHQRTSTECFLYICAGMLTFAISTIGRQIVPQIDTTFPEFFTAIFAVCATAPIGITTSLVWKNTNK